MKHLRNGIYFYENGSLLNTKKTTIPTRTSEKGYVFFQTGNNIYFYHGQTAYQELKEGNYPEPILVECITDPLFKKAIMQRVGLTDKSLQVKIFTHCKRLCDEVFE